MSRLAVAAVVAAVITNLGGCTRRQQDFAWFAAAVAIEVAQTANEIEEANRTPVVVSAPDPGPSNADLARSHEIAMELTAIAAADARADKCDAVLRTSDQVRVIDPDVFARVFLKDVAIQRCLAITP